MFITPIERLVQASYAVVDGASIETLRAAVEEHRRLQAALRSIIDESGEMLHGPQGSVRLTRNEQGILLAIVMGDGEPVTKDDIGRAVWPHYRAGMGSSHTVETHMYRLRQKMLQVGARASIPVADGRGYRLELQP